MTELKVPLGARALRTPTLRRRVGPLTPLTWVVIALFAVLILYPLAKTVIGFATDTETATDNVWSVLSSAQTLGALKNTLIIVVISGICSVLVGAALAWLNFRTNARIGWLAEILPLLSMFVPSLASAIGWVFLLDPQLGALNIAARDVLSVFGIHLTTGPIDIYTMSGLIWLYTIFLTPFAYVAIANGFQSLDPALEEAGKVSGARPLKIFLTITLPNLRPAIGGAAMVVIIMGCTMFSIPVIIGARAQINVLPVLIVEGITQAYPVDQIQVLSRSLLLVAIVLLALWAQRRFVGASSPTFATLSGKSNRASKVELGGWRIPLRVIMLAYLVAAAILPFLGLIFVSLQRFWSINVQWNQLSLGSYVQMFQQNFLVEGLRNSLLFGVIGATAVSIVALLVSYHTDVRRPRFSALVDTLMKLPATVPHIVLAIALLSAFSGPPIRLGSTGLLIIAYVVIYLPQASFYISSATQQLGKSVFEASHVAGASNERSFLRVFLPLVAPAIASGWALIFVLMSGDVTASAMLASTGTPVVGFVMLDQWVRGTYPTIAAVGVTITVVSAVVVIAAMAIRSRFRLDR